MLARRLRLAKEKDFKRIFKLGKSSYAKIFGIKVLANKLEVNRYGIVISANVSKKATDRNKLKRQLRAIIKEFDEKIIQGFDLVIIVAPAVLSQKYEFIKSELKKLLVALKLFKLGK
ncbi:MAG: ribonuclease P protein component [Patescibacteria group bacterium]|jgi:ribonuclease P protein component